MKLPDWGKDKRKGVLVGLRINYTIRNIGAIIVVMVGGIVGIGYLISGVMKGLAGRR